MHDKYDKMEGGDVLSGGSAAFPLNRQGDRVALKELPSEKACYLAVVLASLLFESLTCNKGRDLRVSELSLMLICCNSSWVGLRSV